MRAVAMLSVMLCLGCVAAPSRAGSAALQPMAAGTLGSDAGLGPVKPPLAPTAAGTFAARAQTQPAAGHAPTAGAGGSAEAAALAAVGGASGESSQSLMADAVDAATPAQRAPTQAGSLVISEIMVDPKTLSDSQGEWVEFENLTDEAFDLQGCELDDGGKTPHSIASSLPIAARGYATIARSEQAGFTADYVASVSFTNTADSVVLRCQGVEIDGVHYDKAAGFPLVSGASLSLDPAHADATDNDAANAWCAARDSYGPELGTPGRPNPDCSSDLDAGVTR
jgi:hypothetical protein